MKDRSLLTLAAKAAGISIRLFNSNGHAVIDQQGGGPESCLVTIWNPLVDDGQALRLAVKLDIPISPESCNGTVWICRGELQIFEALGGDGNAAVRRAIVRAAAEIGRGME